MGGFRLAHTSILARVTGLRENIVPPGKFLTGGSFPGTRPHPVKRLRENGSLGCSKIDNGGGHKFHMAMINCEFIIG